jgi:hypothetical protein
MEALLKYLYTQKTQTEGHMTTAFDWLPLGLAWAAIKGSTVVQRSSLWP